MSSSPQFIRIPLGDSFHDIRVRLKVGAYGPVDPAGDSVRLLNAANGLMDLKTYMEFRHTDCPDRSYDVIAADLSDAAQRLQKHAKSLLD